jgi:hypothetical protein
LSWLGPVQNRPQTTHWPAFSDLNAGGIVIVANQYEELVKLALFCANQARTSVMKDAAREAWRLAAEYRDQAAQLGEPPNIGKKPPHIEEL